MLSSKQIVVEAALALFREQSYLTVNLQMVAELSGATEAAVISLFGNKSELAASAVAYEWLWFTDGRPFTAGEHNRSDIFFEKLKHYQELYAGPLLIDVLSASVPKSETTLQQQLKIYGERWVAYLNDLSQGVHQPLGRLLQVMYHLRKEPNETMGLAHLYPVSPEQTNVLLPCVSRG